jgi:hypothetical protein
MAVAIMMLILVLLLVLVVTITAIVVTPVAIERRDESFAGEPPDKPAQPCEKALRMLLWTFH